MLISFKIVFAKEQEEKYGEGLWASIVKPYNIILNVPIALARSYRNAGIITPSKGTRHTKHIYACIYV